MVPRETGGIMQRYHGDLSRYGNSVSSSHDGGKQVLVALFLLLTLGMLGAHRLYLGMRTTAFIQLCIFAFGMMFGLASLNGALMAASLGILALWLLFDIVFVIVAVR